MYQKGLILLEEKAIPEGKELMDKACMLFTMNGKEHYVKTAREKVQQYT